MTDTFTPDSSESVLIDWQTRTCAICRKPLVRVDTPYGDGWRLDCTCHNAPSSPTPAEHKP